jgi:hypothetical protein
MLCFFWLNNLSSQINENVFGVTWSCNLNVNVHLCLYGLGVCNYFTLRCEIFLEKFIVIQLVLQGLKLHYHVKKPAYLTLFWNSGV